MIAARDKASPDADEALASLCRMYWYPLYTYVRSQVRTPDEAQDLTQEFFARLIEKDFLAGVDQAKGRFRSFLLAACRHFLANERQRAAAQKRGGGQPALPLDFEAAEERYRHDPSHELTPERLFERRWAMALLDQVLARLREDYTRAGKARLFDRLKVFLTSDGGLVDHQELAREIGITHGALKVAAHRLRRRYRARLETEIARTLGERAGVEGEIRHLLAALGRARGEGQ